MNRTPPLPDEPNLRKLSGEEIEPFHYARTMARVRPQMERNQPMMLLKKKTTAVSGVLVAFFCALLFIPAAYSVRVGSIVKAEFEVSDQTPIEQIVQATSNLEGVVNQNIAVRNNQAELTVTFREHDGPDAETSLLSILSDYIADSKSISIETDEIRKQMGGNALAAISGGKIRIFAEHLTDGQIEQQISSELAARGLLVRRVNVSSEASDDGTRKTMEIRIEAEAPEGTELPPCDEIEFNILGETDGEKAIIIKKKECQEKCE